MLHLQPASFRRFRLSPSGPTLTADECTHDCASDACILTFHPSTVALKIGRGTGVSIFLPPSHCES